MEPFFYFSQNISLCRDFDLGGQSIIFFKAPSTVVTGYIIGTTHIQLAGGAAAT